MSFAAAFTPSLEEQRRFVANLLKEPFLPVGIQSLLKGMSSGIQSCLASGHPPNHTSNRSSLTILARMRQDIESLMKFRSNNQETIDEFHRIQTYRYVNMYGEHLQRLHPGVQIGAMLQRILGDLHRPASRSRWQGVYNRLRQELAQQRSPPNSVFVSPPPATPTLDGFRKIARLDNEVNLASITDSIDMYLRGQAGGTMPTTVELARQGRYTEWLQLLKLDLEQLRIRVPAPLRFLCDDLETVLNQQIADWFRPSFITDPSGRKVQSCQLTARGEEYLGMYFANSQQNTWSVPPTGSLDDMPAAPSSMPQNVSIPVREKTSQPATEPVPDIPSTNTEIIDLTEPETTNLSTLIDQSISHIQVSEGSSNGWGEEPSMIIDLSMEDLLTTPDGQSVTDDQIETQEQDTLSTEVTAPVTADEETAAQVVETVSSAPEEAPSSEDSGKESSEIDWATILRPLVDVVATSRCQSAASRA